MIFAARKLQGIGLIMLLTICALVAYPVTLQVSATRAELRKVETRIGVARQRIRMLEGDIAVLANARQLERWNREYFGYVPPSAGQYLSGERELASLDVLRPATDRVDAPVLVRLAAAERPAAGVASQGDRVAMFDRARVSDVALSDIAAAAAPQLSVTAMGGQ